MRLAAIALLLVLGTTMASAQAPTEAEKLFEEGRQLMDAGQPEAACARFEQSIAKDPRQVGVLMNLGLCNERVGKLATALKLYREAYERASEAGLPGATAAAKKEMVKLASRVPVIELSRAGAPLEGERVLVDDLVVPLDQTELPIDPGSHTVVVTAPGRLPYETRVDVRGTDRKVVRIPVLAEPKNKIVETERSPQRFIGKLLTFGGAAITVVGVGLAIYAKRDYDSLFEGPSPHCGAFPPVDGRAVCDATGQSRAERDRKIGTAATFVGGAGLAIALTGAILWATSPSEAPRTTIVPTATGDSVGVSFGGRF